MPNAKVFFSEEEKAKIMVAIAQAENATSGEIRVHLEEKCGDDVIKRSTQIFAKLNMHKTELKNGVLIYLAVKDKKFAIIGDEGINNSVPENFWDTIKNNMQTTFSEGRFLDGIINAIYESGEQLKHFFPTLHSDINEVSDEISFHDD